MKQLKIKDLMSTGVYAVLYFICVGIGTLIGTFVIGHGHMVWVPAFCALLSGVVYMVLVAKVGKFGAISLVGLMMALFFLAVGRFFLSFVPSLVFGIAADYIASSGAYRNKWTNLVSYVVFSFGNIGPIFLMWLTRDAYVANLMARGKDMAYINTVMVAFDWQNVALVFGSVIVFGIIGGLFGQAMVQKHFVKAGMVK